MDILGQEPTNFQILTKLCTDLVKGMNKRFSVGDIFYRGENPGGPRPSDRGLILIFRYIRSRLLFDVMRYYIDLFRHKKSFKSYINALK